MIDDLLEDLQIYQDIAADLKRKFKDFEIVVLLKIYRHTKAGKSPLFQEQTLKRIGGYRDALKNLRKRGLIYLIKGKGPYRIVDDGVRTAVVILTLIEKGYLDCPE